MHKHPLEKSLIVLDTSRDDTHQIVTISTHRKTFDDFWMTADSRFEILKIGFVVTSYSNMSEDIYRESEPACIQDHRATRDNS